MAGNDKKKDSTRKGKSRGGKIKDRVKGKIKEWGENLDDVLGDLLPRPQPVPVPIPVRPNRPPYPPRR